MILTIIGLSIPTLVSVVGTITGDKGRGIKAGLLSLAIAGFGLAIYSARGQGAARAHAEDLANATQEKLTLATERLQAQGQMLALVNMTVGDLAILNTLSGGTKYYVRIATDSSPARLTSYKEAIEGQFGAAKANGLVLVRAPRSGSRNYELIFGAGLDLAAAEVFQRLAMSHGLPPAGQIATIRPEPEPK